jgi:hypothetical protein
MSRRTIAQPDSLEMLLDTMCNTFGGIILIALLVALLTREHRLTETERRALTQNSSMLDRQIEQLEQEIAEARRQQDQTAAPAANPEVMERSRLAERRDQLRREIEMLQQALQTGQTQLISNTAPASMVIGQRVLQESRAVQAARIELTQARVEGEAMQSRIQELQTAMVQASNLLAEARGEQVQRLRLPREHETSRNPYFLILRFGKVYPVYILNNGQPEPNTQSLRWIDEPESLRRLEPVATQGLDPIARPPSWTAFLQRFPKETYYMVFQVYEDSFPAFTTVKTAAVRAGVEFTWQPRRNPEVLKLGVGPAPPPPQ